ncbi:sensor histidine kinase [Chamaesiphon polymorphus]|uniref:histidine kinase n=1 Tax=Chamaesiphon polymorphus CCALA 037 TaxID=2107692 RepID=A0A2T1GKT3_9CYAN|nr:ATP-binding protein [Chamaesiphon polymorphus]PSB58452.1 two-component sensor histidine kinase [Chamaesiphon polymorphus CCALA 037]
MPPTIDRFRAKLQQIKQRHFDPASLQFRLTVEISLLSILGLSGVAVWTSWKMQQLLITTHTQQVEYIATRFPRDVQLYSEMLPVATGLQKTIDSVSVPGLAIWVKSTDGKKILAQSGGVSTELMSIADMPLKPQVYPVGDRFLILYRGGVTVRGESLGKVYMAQDVTQEQSQLMSAIQGLAAVCILSLFLTTIAIALRIRRSLQPLQEMSQMAGAISAADLNKAQLQLSQAPTEVKELAQTFNMMLARLAESWEQQRQFVGNVSHELRTPLTVVLGYLQSLLRRSTNLNDYQQEALQTAADEADRTVRLLQDLLNLARADSGYAHYSLERLSLNDVVTEVVQMTEKYSDRVIRVEAIGNIAAIADRDRLKQVLINLIDNAVKYSDAEQPIILSIDRLDGQALIRVRDRGVGIPLQDQSRIFERFYRVDEARARTTGGHGLGLAIVKTLVEGMGGNVTVRSKLGAGTEFSIALPT